MTMPGFITGRPISGQQLGQAILNFLPAFPGEGPPFMPRALAKAIFPQGFVPGRIPALPAAMVPTPRPLVPVAPPANQVPAQPLAPVRDARGNTIVRTQPPAPRKRVLERGTFPSWQ